MNKAGVQAQLANQAFRTLIDATNPWCLKILHGARDRGLADRWVARRRTRGGGVLMLRYVTGDDVQIADLPRLTTEALALFQGWQVYVGGGITVILELALNEKFHTDMGQFADLAEASIPQAQRVKDAGFTPGVLVTSEGNPPGDNYGAAFFQQPRVLAAMRAFRRMGAIWCPHGYSHPPTAADDPWHFDRPRHILAQLPEDARLNYAFGEIGCDGGCDLPEKKPGRGWVDYFPNVGAYAAWMRGQVEAMAADPLCVAGGVFLSGADPSGNPNFVSFDVRDEVDFRRVLTDDVPGPPITWLGPTPVPTPVPPPKPPEVPTVPDVIMSVPSRTALAFYLSEQEGNYSKVLRARTIGVVIHSTGGSSSSLANEANSTVNWFQNPDAQVSAHRVVGPSDVTLCVPDALTAYHARENNADHLGVEIAMPDRAGLDYTAFQYEATAELLARWARAYGFPLRWVTDQTQPGLICHKDAAAGKRDGRRDPTGSFAPDRLLAAALVWQAKLKGGTPVPPVPNPDALQEQVYALADQLQKLGPQYDVAGFPHRAAFVRTQGEALKEWVNTASKGQK